MRTVCVILSVVLVSAIAAPAFEGYGDSVSRKADRGFSNTLGGWLEIPYQTYAVSKEKGLLTGATLGLCKGIVWTPLRMLSGVVDIATFPAPFPHGWEGVMTPEYNQWVEVPVAAE